MFHNQGNKTMSKENGWEWRLDLLVALEDIEKFMRLRELWRYVGKSPGILWGELDCAPDY
jgi:hypothetical protein